MGYLHPVKKDTRKENLAIIEQAYSMGFIDSTKYNFLHRALEAGVKIEYKRTDLKDRILLEWTLVVRGEVKTEL